MLRRSLAALMGAPPAKRIPGPPIVHASQRPAADANIDFSQLGLEFPLVRDPTFVLAERAWSPKPDTIPNYPFMVDRACSGTSLPVYSDYKGGGTKVVTVLRKVKGDIPKLKAEMEKVVGREVFIRSGRLEVDGNYVRRVKAWLIGLGF